ncbi:hypothetical protein ACSBR2_021412 [Camellia fascicularis]
MEHNHPLATSPCVPFLRSHRFVKIPDKAQVRTLHDVGNNLGLSRMWALFTRICTIIFKLSAK